MCRTHTHTLSLALDLTRIPCCFCAQSQLPEAAGKRLFDSITKTLANWPRPSCRSARPDSVDNEFHEDPARQLELRCSFIAFFVELFGCYQEHLTFLRRYPTPVPIFNKAAFLKASHPSAIVRLLSLSLSLSLKCHLLAHHYTYTTCDCCAYRNSLTPSWKRKHSRSSSIRNTHKPTVSSKR